MSLPDVHQDVIVFAANALKKLLEQERLRPEEICRIYVGTESGIDSSKPIGSFLISLMEDLYGEGSFEHCDVVDLTFACIGGVDALHNSLDYIRVNPDKKAIVIGTDYAKYDLNSTGEYTQGAGAVALLLSANPKIISISNKIGISTQGVFDFFKPKRSLSKKEVTEKDTNPIWFGIEENEIDLFKEQPVFDGQYSNMCYQNRLKGAYFHLKKLLSVETTLYQHWKNIIVHSPYSFQGRRMFSEIYALDSDLKESLSTQEKEYADKIKEIGKTEEYQSFVKEKFAPAEVASSHIGNMYTGSIFMGLLSTLSYHVKNNTEITGEKFGFLAYGSGSKSKAFEGIVEKDWKIQSEKLRLFETLDNTYAIDMDTYHSLYKKELKKSVLTPKNEYILERIENENPVLIGARYYKFKK